MDKDRMLIILLAGFFVLSCIVAINLLLRSSPTYVQMEGNTFRVLEIPYAYTRTDAYILFVAGVLSGITGCKLFSLKKDTSGGIENRDIEQINTEPALAPEAPIEPDLQKERVAGVLLKALEGDERRTVKLIVDNGGRMLQNDLVNSLNFSKAKVSRILFKLEQRKIIIKEKYGLTNSISISEHIWSDHDE
jgi:hypothetical protein